MSAPGLSDSGGQSKLFTSELQYYQDLRDEIKREDNITHQRLTSSLTLQGLLITSSSLIVSERISFISKFSLVEFSFLLAIGLIGFFIAISSIVGVHASRLSMDSARKRWELYVDKHEIDLSLYIQPFRRETYFKFGHFYSYSMPLILAISWIIYVFGVMSYALYQYFNRL